MCIQGRAKTKVIRRQYGRQGLQVTPGLLAFTEVKLDDVPIWTDFNTVSIIAFDAEYVSQTNAADVVRMACCPKKQAGQ